MEHGRLGEDRANIIRNAILTDGTFCGTPEWLESHHVDREEFEAFLDYAVRLSQMYDWRDANRDVGSVEVALTFTKHSGKVGSSQETWQVFAPTADTMRILRVAESGEVDATLTPRQMPLDLDGVALVDVETGEVVGG